MSSSYYHRYVGPRQRVRINVSFLDPYLIIPRRILHRVIHRGWNTQLYTMAGYNHWFA